MTPKAGFSRLRFCREDGTEYPAWTYGNIGEHINVTSSKRVHQSEWTESGIPFYRAREIVSLYNSEKITPLHISVDTYNDYSAISGKIKKGDLLVTGVGTIGIPYLVKEDDNFYFKDGNIIWFQNDESYLYGEYLYYVFGTNKLQKQIFDGSGKGTVHTYTIENAKSTVMPIPCLEEQLKIADFLSTVDAKIAAQKNKLKSLEDAKKGVMQRIFSRQVRFRRDDGTEYPEWEETTVQNCLAYEQPQKYIVASDRYNNAYATPVLTANKGFILGYTDEAFGLYDKGPVIIYDDFTMDMKYVTFSFKVKSSAMKMITAKPNYSLYFMYALLLSKELHSDVHSRSWISVVEPMSVQVPCFEEQQKIADFLSTFDAKIAAVQKKIEAWETIKKGLMQRLFV